MMMKTAFLFLIFGLCCGCDGLGATTDDRLFSLMKSRIAKWEEAGLPNRWTEEAPFGAYEFFLWNKQEDTLQWFVLRVGARGDHTSKVTLHFGLGEKETGTNELDPSRAEYLLSEIGKSELFRLPTLVGGTDAPQVMFANTGLVFFLARRKLGERPAEVFRWVGESYPVEKVVAALMHVAAQR